jgi:hypothetical protein
MEKKKNAARKTRKSRPPRGNLLKGEPTTIAGDLPLFTDIQLFSLLPTNHIGLAVALPARKVVQSSGVHLLRQRNDNAIGSGDCGSSFDLVAPGCRFPLGWKSDSSGPVGSSCRFDR